MLKLILIAAIAFTGYGYFSHEIFINDAEVLLLTAISMAILIKD